MEDLESNAYRTVFESIRNPVILLDRNGRIRTMNHEAVLLVDEWAAPGHAYYVPPGTRDADARATRIRVLFAGRSFAEVFPWIAEAMSVAPVTDHVRSFECVLRLPESARSFEARVSPVLDAEQDTDGSLVILTDVTEGKQLLRRLHDLATTDALTGAANRRSFLERSRVELERSRRYGRPMAILILDVDRFKPFVNDAYGHAAGDEVLMALTQAAREDLRLSDLLGRVGGEEFAALLPETDLVAARFAAERLRAVMAALVVRADGHEVRFTVSVGVAAISAQDETVESILGRADAALYVAKRSGRDRVVAAEEPVSQA